MPKPVRRIVTGHNAKGRSVFIEDGWAPHVVNRSPGAAEVTELWVTSTTPADNRGGGDPIPGSFQIPPPGNGSVFRIVEYPPDGERIAALWRAQGDPSDTLYRPTARHPGFHKTATIDYAIVLAGEIFALMDEGEALLKPGDVLIQRGTNHAWSNRTDRPATVAFVLIEAEPV